MNYRQALQILKLPDPPSPSEVKKAFRAQALTLHPDRNGGDPKTAQAFQICLDAYNYLIEHPLEWSAPAQPAGNERVEDLGDIFDDIFGFTREDRILGFETPQALALTLVELAYGVVKRAKLNAYEKCATCAGSGSLKNAPVTICTYCFGSGRISPPGREGEDKRCPKCEGRGRKIQKPCPACAGFGRKRVLRLQEVSIPAGLKAGGSYTLRSRDLKTDKPFDLFTRISMMPHPVFAVENSDILCEYPVPETLKASGGRIDFPGLWGWVPLTVPAGANAGDELRVTGQGMPLNPTGERRGDLLIRIRLLPDGKCRKEARVFLNRLASQHPLYADRLPWWRRLLRKHQL